MSQMPGSMVLGPKLRESAYKKGGAGWFGGSGQFPSDPNWELFEC